MWPPCQSRRHALACTYHADRRTGAARVIVLGIILAVVASIAFASGATAQHRGIDKVVGPGGDRHMSLRRVLQMLRTPVWLLGLVLIGVGATLHLIALKLAPLTVIQPLGIMAVPWSVLLAARLKRQRPGRMIWVSVAVTVAGIVTFTIFSTTHATTKPDLTNLPRLWLFTGAVWGLAVLFGFGGRFGLSWLRCLSWAWGGAALYGLGSGFIKNLIEILSGPSPLAHPMLWVSIVGLATAYTIGGWMIQQGYASGPAEIVVGSMTTVDPLTSVLFGLFVLGEGAAITVPAAIGMLVAGSIACAGVVLLSRHHPDAHRQYQEPAEAEA